MCPFLPFTCPPPHNGNVSNTVLLFQTVSHSQALHTVMLQSIERWPFNLSLSLLTSQLRHMTLPMSDTCDIHAMLQPVATVRFFSNSPSPCKATIAHTMLLCRCSVLCCPRWSPPGGVLGLLSACLSVCLSVCLCVCLSVCLFVCLPVCR